MENVKYPEKNTHEQTKNIKKGFQDPIKKTSPQYWKDSKTCKLP